MPCCPYLVVSLALLGMVTADELRGGGIQVLTDANVVVAKESEYILPVLAQEDGQCDQPKIYDAITQLRNDHTPSSCDAPSDFCFYVDSSADCTDPCTTWKPSASDIFSIDFIKGNWKGCGMLASSSMTEALFKIDQLQCTGDPEFNKGSGSNKLPTGDYTLKCKISYTTLTKCLFGVVALALVCCCACCCFCSYRMCCTRNRNIQTVSINTAAASTQGQFQQHMQQQPFRQMPQICPKDGVCPKGNPSNNMANTRPTNEQPLQLPPGWMSKQDPSGKMYFWHESDPGASRTWERPTAPWQGAQRQESPLQER